MGKRVALMVIGSLLAGPAAHAQTAPEQPAPEPGEAELAREVENPVGELGSIPLQNQVDFGMGPHARVENTLSLQPTYGFAMSRDVAIVSRTTVPMVSRPDLTRPNGYVSGLGDVGEMLLLARAPTASGVLWGLGATTLLPTATAREIGSGKLGIGPAAALLVQSRRSTIAIVAAQTWSIAGAAERPEVNQLNVTPLASFRFGRGWSVSTAPSITARWNASARNTWTVPVGGEVGKVFFARTVPIEVSVGGYWNAIRPENAASASLLIRIALLFPHE